MPARQLTVAVLGTGIMGAAMARNLARAGHTVTAWNRTRERAEPLAKDGARIAGTPAEAVADADVVLTMVYDGPAALDAMRQAAPALRPGTVWVQSTTAGIDAIAELAAFAHAHDLVFYDAPVLGTKAPAEAGRLTVLAAGPEAGRETAGPVFDAVGARTVWTGEDGAAGSATRLKLVANSWVLAVTGAAGEVLNLAHALGVDPDSFFATIDGGPLDTGYLRAKTTLVREDRLSPASFAVTTAAKDARLIVEAGRRHGVRLDIAEAGAARFGRAVAQGHGDEDMAAAYFAGYDADAELGRVHREVGTREVPDGTADTVLLRRTYETGAADLWDALTSPGRLGRWFLPVSGELAPGGHYRLEGNAAGEILECVAPERLRLSWLFGPDPGLSEVTVRLTPAGPARTVLELDHVAVASPEFRERYGPGAAGVGWDMALHALARHVAGATLGRAEATAWEASAEGRAFLTHAGEAWGAAYAAAGADPRTVESTTAATVAFYTGAPAQ
ncbi:dehydrogenase [Streptomyces laurentii]|uniref:Dehydrogenase n=1 Tax=Streptomyces laurentii TaxID=39478 RepID=A0A160P8V7_STRLU|nr:dehydrogenase [Streptomyces laurentii]